jgi:hypothetical protein
MSLDLVVVPGTNFQVKRSILAPLTALLTKYKAKLTAAYAVTGHAPNGDHPKGLGVDIVPDAGRGGTWADIDRLAAAAEPTQNHPSQGFRWVGYNGDPNHGRGNHLHLSFEDPSAGGKSVLGSIIGAPFDALGAVGDYAQGLGEQAAHRGDDGVKDALGDIAGVAGSVIPSAGEIASKAADAIVGQAVDAIGKDLLRWTLYAALVLGGLALFLFGGARALGAGTSSTS